MAEKDRSEKYLEEYPDVFADIVNVLLLQGDYVLPKELYNGPTESIYKAENGIDIKEQRRDISKYLIRDNKIVALFGIENQSYIDKDMAVRIMGYDYSSYRSQMISGKERYPVITIVLNFTNKKWDAPVSVGNYPLCPKEFCNILPDYSYHVINVAYLSGEVRQRMKSDFKLIADFFTERRLYGTYTPTDEVIIHEMAVLNMLRIFTNDKRYDAMEKIVKAKKEKGESITMCTFADEMENRGIHKGRIMEAVLIYTKEMHLEKKDVLNRIMQKFSLGMDEAEKYLIME